MSMKVGQVMNRPVVATTVDTPLRDIASQLVAGRISGMPVANRDGTVVGVVTEYDVVSALLDGKMLDTVKAGDVMEKEVITLDVGATLEVALEVFKERHVIRIPVTENGKLVGILSRTDAIRGILEAPEFLVF